jgi:hypothetical protein
MTAKEVAAFLHEMPIARLGTRNPDGTIHQHLHRNQIQWRK